MQDRTPSADALREAAAVLRDRVTWRREYERDASCPPGTIATTDRLEGVAIWLQETADNG